MKKNLIVSILIISVLVFGSFVGAFAESDDDVIIQHSVNNAIFIPNFDDQNLKARAAADYQLKASDVVLRLTLADLDLRRCYGEGWTDVVNSSGQSVNHYTTVAVKNANGSTQIQSERIWSVGPKTVTTGLVRWEGSVAHVYYGW